MKKKIKDFTIQDIVKMCGDLEFCDWRCPLYKVCSQKIRDIALYESIKDKEVDL